MRKEFRTFLLQNLGVLKEWIYEILKSIYAISDEKVTHIFNIDFRRLNFGDLQKVRDIILIDLSRFLAGFNSEILWYWSRFFSNTRFCLNNFRTSAFNAFISFANGREYESTVNIFSFYKFRVSLHNKWTKHAKIKFIVNSDSHPYQRTSIKMPLNLLSEIPKGSSITVVTQTYQCLNLEKVLNPVPLGNQEASAALD